MPCFMSLDPRDLQDISYIGTLVQDRYTTVSSFVIGREKLLLGGEGVGI